MDLTVRAVHDEAAGGQDLFQHLDWHLHEQKTDCLLGLLWIQLQLFTWVRDISVRQPVSRPASV